MDTLILATRNPGKVFELRQLLGGLGREVLLAVNRSDYPVIQAVTIYIAVITMTVNLLTDVLYKLADPRVVLK